jgi:hypothetical protein
MKVIALGVAIWAGITRSPWFSGSPSSIKINIRPARASSRISSIGEMPDEVRREATELAAANSDRIYIYPNRPTAEWWLFLGVMA